MGFREGFNPSAFPDWAFFLEQWKNTLSILDSDVSTLTEKAEAMEETANTLKQFVNTYFARLDVSNEIDKKIDRMVLDGSFETTVIPALSEVVSTWLDGNITEPVGVVIDSSLNITGAAADSKATGTAVNAVDNKIGQLKTLLGVPYNITLTKGGFNTTTDIHTDETNNARARSAVFTITEPTTISPLASDFSYHVIKQPTGGTPETITPSYITTPFKITDVNAEYRLLCRNASGTGSVTVVSGKEYFALAGDSFVIERVENMEKRLNQNAITTDNNFVRTVLGNIAPSDYVFVLCGDNHYNELEEDGQNQLLYAQKMIDIANRVGASAVVNLGDICAADSDDHGAPYDVNVNYRRLRKIVGAFRSKNIPFLYTPGQHELYPYIGMVDGEAVYTGNKRVVSDIAHCPGKYNDKDSDNNSFIHYAGDGTKKNVNFYVDDTAKKIRLVFLDGVSVGHTGYSYNTIEFFRNAIATLPNDYKLAAFAHSPVRQGASVNGQPVPGGDTVLSGENLPPDVSSYAYTINGVAHDFALTGRFVGFFHGHCHIDNLVTNGGYNLVCENCSRVTSVNVATFNSVTEGGSNKKRWTGRHNWLDNAYSFDVVVVKNGSVNMYRYGVGNNRTFTY